MDSKKICIAALAVLLFNAGMAATGAALPLDGTKHDLSSAGTGSYKAKIASQGGTTEICIFCHTPHGGNTDAPLWNRTNPASYQPYTSDVLAGLAGGAGYWPAEDPKTGVPHAKTRICLSCHDGTIALGSVVNMPNIMSGTKIQMAGEGEYILQKAPGYIGLDLRDDHPVAIKHDNGKDPELVAGASVGGGVRLYNATAKVQNVNESYVECTSCHEPHNNQFGNFLVASNAGSALCLQCHTKTGFASPSKHFTATDAYSPPDGTTGGNLGTQVQGVQCMNCHFPHKAGITDVSQLPAANPNLVANPKAGYYLLAFQEEMTCFNNTNRWGQTVSICHGSSATTNRNIQTVENNASSGKRHWTQDSGTVGRHEATEGQSSGWINVGGSQAKWHVECADCHNAHTAGGTNHTAGTNVVGSTSPLYGAGGVSMPGTPRTWTGSPGSGYAYREPLGVINTGNTSIQYEYEICFKCHTDFAWGISPPNSPSLTAPMTDQAMEFNTATVNGSFHPVVGANPSNLGTMRAASGWSTGSNLMYCSDCHTLNSTLTTPPSRPLGPHGSSHAAILRNPFSTSPGTLGGGAGGAQSGNDLCFECHDTTTYLTPNAADSNATGFSMSGGNNLHAKHAQYAISAPTVTNPYSYKCVNCHIRIPHGYNRPAMITISTDAAPYNAGSKITAVPTFNPNSYIKTNCSTANGCHQ